MRLDSLDGLIVALCRDTARREHQISREDVSRRTKTELRYISYKINEAAREVVGDDYMKYIREIGESVGYAKSQVGDISEAAYKLKKAEIKLCIARKLHLSD